MLATHAIRLLLALTILVSVVLRPPGTMLILDGDKISYELCTGGEIETVTVALGGDPQQNIDLGCDFFASHVADIPFTAPDVVPTVARATRLATSVAPKVHRGQHGWSPYTPRGPPFVSCLSHHRNHSQGQTR